MPLGITEEKKWVLHFSHLETKVSRQRPWFNHQNEQWSDELYEDEEGNTNKVMGESSKKFLGSLTSEVFEQAAGKQNLNQDQGDFYCKFVAISNLPCKLLATLRRFESPVVLFTGDLKSRLNRR